jgi:hypothetical protein
MPKEIKQDGDIRFEGFSSYPNSCTFSGDSGMLEYAENVDMLGGKVFPRMGYTLAGTATAPVTYACAAQSSTGDSILLWGTNQRFNCQSGTFTSVNLASKQKARGQGYQDALTMETADTDFVAGGNIVERLVTAKGDKLKFTLYSGVAPYEPDSAYLVQQTYDEIQAIIPEVNSMTILGRRSVYEVQAGLGRQANIDRKAEQVVFHKIQRLSKNDGVVGKDAWANFAGNISFLDVDGIKVFSEGKFGEGISPISDAIYDIIKLIDPAKLSEVCAVGLKNNAYYALPLLAPYNKTVVLKMNSDIKGIFESIDVYPDSIDLLCVAKKDGISRVWGINKQYGRIYLMDNQNTDNGTAVQSRIRSRNYFFATHGEKRYENCYVFMDTKGSAEVEFNFISTNPDGVWLLDKFNDNLGTAVRRALANKKSMIGKLEIVVKSGRPHIMSIGVEASLIGRSIFSSF